MAKSNVINFLVGGKLGDFIQSLYAVKGICEYKVARANIYLYDIGWDFGIENTYAELYPIIMQQDYVKNFTILDKLHYTLDPMQTPTQNSPIQIHSLELIEQGWIDLGEYIRSPYLYKASWTTLFSNTFNFPKPEEPWWIQYKSFDERFINKVVLHRKHSVRVNETFPHKQIIDHYKDDVVFVSSNDVDYDTFPHKEGIPYVKLQTLDDWFACINSSALFISNLTGPAAIAHALDKPRIIELPETIDSFHCMGEEAYSDNIQWFLDYQTHTLT